jgi:hypothetical protein
MNYIKSFLTVAACLIAVSIYAQKPNSPGSVFYTDANKQAGWPLIKIPSPDAVRLNGYLGNSLEKGTQRLALPPYSADWLLSDVSFKIKRIFNNYSGDVSGRFLELAVLTSPDGQLKPAALPIAIESVVSYQKSDGHFGVDIDLDKPMVRNSAEVTMLWGNARMLVGLIVAARELKDERLMASAIKLGDFYINTAHQLCSSARLEEYRSTGTAADSYQVGYFPAMEGLVMLYKDTKDERYLQHAKKMADFFYNFDVLPNDHSHGNLSAWRSILDIYGLEKNASCLQKAEAKWNAAVNGGFVWPLGGVGEHWYISFNGDEGCSESDWLRFNLDLWRYTGKTKYLDMAERLLKNQYISNQTPNGGYGMRHLDTQATGPIATGGAVNEWDFCCSFHGPLGLYFLKSYLATGSENDIYINFPLDYQARVEAGGSDWNIGVKTNSGNAGSEQMDIQVVPVASKPAEPVNIWLRVPYWASTVQIGNAAASPVKTTNGYIEIKHGLRQNTAFKVTFQGKLTIEGRRFTAVNPTPGEVFTIEDVSLLHGPNLLFETHSRGPLRSKLLAVIDDEGNLGLLKDADGSLATVSLKGNENNRAQILNALAKDRKVSLASWPLSTTRRSAFVYDLVIVPEGWINRDASTRFASRKKASQIPYFGNHLEKRTELWPVTMPWTFGPDGIYIKGGNVGLIEGEGYENYRFAFDITLPKEGQGITGWIVHAKDENDCIMFQIQTRDSPYNFPQFKTKQNTLRPLIRRSGRWEVLDPVPLPVEFNRGEKRHIVTECKGNSILVYIDGQKVHEQNDKFYGKGAVGFRVNETLEQALFSNIMLQKL